jgi:hypothetical protein
MIAAGNGFEQAIKHLVSGSLPGGGNSASTRLPALKYRRFVGAEK